MTPRLGLLLGLLLALALPGHADIGLILPGGGGGGGTGNVSVSGTPTAGQLAEWVNATTIQGISTLSLQVTDFDVSTATRTRPNKVDTVDPATCAVGDTLFRSDLAAGSNLKGCTGTNTWTALGGGGGVAAGDSPIWTGLHTFSSAASLGVAGVSTLVGSAQTITLTGADPTTYATVDSYQLNSPTLVGTNVNQTVTLASTLSVKGPIKSTNVAATKVVAINVPTWAASTATTATGLEVNAPTGATNNYAANFTGIVLLATGTGAAPSLAFSAAPATGLYRDTATGRLTTSGQFNVSTSLVLRSNDNIVWSNSTSNWTTGDTVLARDGAANILAMKNAANANEFRIYGTTTGNKYLSLKHDGTNPLLDSSSGALKVGATAITPAATGTRFVCIDTTGTLISSTSACSGT